MSVLPSGRSPSRKAVAAETFSGVGARQLPGKAKVLAVLNARTLKRSAERLAALVQAIGGDRAGGVLHEQDVARNGREHVRALALHVDAEIDEAVVLLRAVDGDRGVQDVLDRLGRGDLLRNLGEEGGDGGFAVGRGRGLDGRRRLGGDGEQLLRGGEVGARGRRRGPGEGGDGRGGLDRRGGPELGDDVGEGPVAFDGGDLAARNGGEVVVRKALDDLDELLARLPRDGRLGLGRERGRGREAPHGGVGPGGERRRLEDAGGGLRVHRREQLRGRGGGGAVRRFRALRRGGRGRGDEPGSQGALLAQTQALRRGGAGEGAEERDARVAHGPAESRVERERDGDRDREERDGSAVGTRVAAVVEGGGGGRRRHC